MAPRSLVAQVGSANWVLTERTEVNNREMECLEDFIVSARNEFEWLNEHMADIFDGTQEIDVIELLKTPGRMRGKTPRTARKLLPLESRQNLNAGVSMENENENGDVFAPSPQKVGTPKNTFYKALNEARKSASPQKNIMESMANDNVQDDEDVEMNDDQEDDDAESTTSSKPPSLVRDSGMWSPESESGPSQRRSTIDKEEDEQEKPLSPEKAGPESVEVASQDITSNRDLSEHTRMSFHSAQESMPELTRQESNSSVVSVKSVLKEDNFREPSPKKVSPKKQSPVKSITIAPEPRRSGRLARHSAEKPRPVENIEVEENPEPAQPSSSFATAHSEAEDEHEDEPMLYVDAGKLELSLTQQDELETQDIRSPEHTAKLSSEDEPESPSSETAISPIQGIVRSSMTFASLPARETLNPKKSIGGPRTSRTSQLENRSSWMGRRTGGKSLGAVSKAAESAKKEVLEEDEDMARRVELDSSDEEDPELDEKLRLAQLNKASTMRPGEKTSTQRLNERISQLGKQMPIRHARSVPPAGFASMQTGATEEDGAVSRPTSSRRPTSDPQGQLSHPPTAHGAADPEEEDWIPARPQMVRAHTAGSTLQSSGESQFFEPAPKESLRSSPRLNNNQAPVVPQDRPISMPPIPTKNVLALASPTKLSLPVAPSQTSPTKLPVPVGLASPYPKLPINEGTAKRPLSAVLSSASTAPTTTPAAQEPIAPVPYKSPFDSAITGLKNRQANLFSKAKQMLFQRTKPESPKPNPESPKAQSNMLETFTSTILRSPTRTEDRAGSPGLKPPSREANDPHPLYPDLNASLKSGPLSPQYQSRANSIYENAPKAHPLEVAKPLQKSPNELKEELEREREAFRRAEEKAAADRRMEEQRREELRLAEEVARKAQEERAAYEERKAQEERRLQQERQAQEERQLQEEQRRQEDEERRRKEREMAKTPVNPRTSHMDLDSDSEENLTDVEMVQKKPATKQVKPTPNTISRIQPPSSASSLPQKQSALKKPIRGPPPKEAGVQSVKSKQAPVNIRLGTASQRAMDQRKIPASTATLVNAMAKSFDSGKEEPQSAQPTPSLSNASSSSSLKSGKSIASITAAAKAQKKEQEEAQRKAAQRQEIERRRQENQRREEEKKQAQVNRMKKAAEKAQEEESKKKAQNNTRPGFTNAKNLPRGLAAATLKKAAEAQLQNTNEPTQPELKRQPKRLFQNELEEQEHQKPRAEPIQSVQSTHSKQQLQPPQQPEAKRRKTDDRQDDTRVQQQPTYQSGPSGAMRQSNMKRDPMQAPKPALFSHGYTPAPSHMQHHPPPSMMKSTLQMVSSTKGQQVAGSATLPQLDAVKFSQDKLKFATPGPSKNIAAALASKMSPQYTNGDSIELPDIPSDSEDEDEDNDPFNVPEWAESPELRQALHNQMYMDPEAVFGPMAPLSMEEIFKGKERSHARFRARTSSANWSGQDKLTAAEIEADRIERQRLIENKKWVFRPPQ